MPEQPRADDYALTIRFTREIERGLDNIRRRTGVGPTDYIRLAVWHALAGDGALDEGGAPQTERPDKK